MKSVTDAQAILEGRVLFAVPKKGRLHQKCLDLLQGANIQYHRESRLDISIVKNLPIAVVFLPAADVPTAVAEGRVDLGITGYDQIAEYGAGLEAISSSKSDSGVSLSDTADEVLTDVEKILDLGFGACRLQVQVPEESTYTKPADLVGMTIGTSFTNLTEQFFAGLEQQQQAVLQNGDLLGKRELSTKIVPLSGSVEAACTLGVADAIVDLVESGETMRAAGLRPIETVISSTAILIKSKSSPNQGLIDLIQSRIAGVISAKQYVLCQYAVLRSKLDAAKKVTVARCAPTISSLQHPDWVSVSAMVDKKSIATVMDKLSEIDGVTGISTLTIANTRI